ncbi:hypothetical protein ALC57_04349, partial [Trachymyrmex cornetzi]
LEKLASYFDKDKLKIVGSEFSTLSDEEFELLTRKGIFPYEYIDCVKKLLCRELGLDRVHCYTLPGFTWDAMLKHTRVKFELLTDIDMVMFIERGIRGGLSQCSGRYAQANNKYMRSYDSSKPSSYLMYYDVNNLYGWAMCQPLPYAEFRWVEDAANFDVSAIAQDSSTGYILEVDLEYPQHLHDRNTDLPFCPTRDKPPGKREDKLLATLYDKQRYVIYYRNLQQCTRHGLRVTKIHRMLQFAQSPWLRDYIELNTQFRTRAKNDFEKNLYKLMNNAVFGKTMEKCDDAYETMKRDIARFDTSDYPADNVYGMPLAYKKVPSLMKDENNGVLMTEFVGLREKMYAVRVDGKKDINMAKGVKSNVVARTITFNYTRCLNEEIEMTRRQSCIRSKLHEVYTISKSKIALSPYVHTYAFIDIRSYTFIWYIHVHTYTFVHIRSYIHVRTYAFIHTRSYVHVNSYTFIRTRSCGYVMDVGTYVFTYVHMYVRDDTTVYVLWKNITKNIIILSAILTLSTFYISLLRDIIKCLGNSVQQILHGYRTVDERLAKNVWDLVGKVFF